MQTSLFGIFETELTLAHFVLSAATFLKYTSLPLPDGNPTTPACLDRGQQFSLHEDFFNYNTHIPFSNYLLSICSMAATATGTSDTDVRIQPRSLRSWSLLWGGGGGIK